MLVASVTDTIPKKTNKFKRNIVFLQREIISLHIQFLHFGFVLYAVQRQGRL